MNEDWQESIDAYLEGTASPEEVVALDLALLEDEELRLRFLVSADLMAELPVALGSGLPAVGVGAAEPEPGEAQPREQKRKLAQPALTWRTFAVAAGVALAPFVLFFVLGPDANDSSDPDAALQLPDEERPTEVSPPPEEKTSTISPASLVLVQGEARLDGATLNIGDRCEAPGQLTVETGGTAVFHYPDGSALTLEESVILRLREAEAGKRIFLHEGALVADMQPQVPGEEMVIETANSKVTVIGTRYRLATTVAEDLLEVEHGKVRLVEKNSGEEHIAEAGDFHRVAGVEANKVSGTLVWRPAGWRPATPDTPNFPARKYQVQRSWFREDFEPGPLPGMWEASAHDTLRYRPFDEPDGDAALEQSNDRRGLPTTVLRLAHPTGSGDPVSLRLLSEVKADQFFLQYLFQPVGEAPFDLNNLCLDLGAVTEREAIHEHGGPEPLAASGSWNQVRIEYLRFWDGERWQLEVRRHLNRQHRETIRLKVERVPLLLFELKSGAVDFDDISLGDLHPVAE